MKTKANNILTGEKDNQVGKQMEIIREEVGVKVKLSLLDYFRNNWGMGGGWGAAAFFSPMHTRRRTLKKLCKDDFAFVSEFPHQEKANQKKDWQAKKEHELTESLYRQVTFMFFRKFTVL
jgi:hypothetical protein